MTTNSAFPRRPSYPETLHQSAENPTQLARLPSGSRPSLQHRLRVTSVAARRTLAFRLAWGIAWRVLLVVVARGLYLYSPRLATVLALGAVLLGVLSVARGLLSNASTLRKWSVYLAVWPVVLVPLLMTDLTYYRFTLAMIAVTMLADRVAGHYYFAHTLPLQRPRAQQKIYLRWKNRFALWERAQRTIPWYALAAATPMGVLALIYYWSEQFPSGYIFHEMYLLVWGAAALWLTALALAVIPEFLYGQRLLTPWRLMQIAYQAVWDWFTYNPRELQYPAIFQSPSGTVQARQALLFGTVLLFSASLVDLAGHVRPSQEDTEPEVAEDLAETVEEPYQRALRERFGGEPPVTAPSLPPEQTPPSDPEMREILLVLVLMAAPYTSLVGIALVPFFLLGSLLPALSRAAAAIPPADQLDQPANELSREDWNRFVKHLQTSPDPIERGSLFLGLNAMDHSPVIVPRTIFQEHAHILGDSGSGKTALGISPLISQLIRSADCSIVLIDLKGDDHALFENARLEAEQAGIPFRWFTNELGRSTYAYNPLAQSHLEQLSLYQRTDLLTASLGLQYGTDYGRGYFSDANAEMLFHALRAHPHLHSFAELAYILRQREPFRTVSAQLKTAGAHLSAIVSRLAATEALNVHPGQAPSAEVAQQAIDMRAAFETPQVMYFHLSSALGTSTTAEIARMAMFSLLTASKFVSRDRRQVYLIVDEFQRVVSNNLELFLQTARSMGIGVILANQSLSDLRKPDVDIISTVRTNTRFRQLFSVGEKNDLEEVIFTSGETLLHGRSWQETVGLSGFIPTFIVKSRTTSEVISPRLRINDILLASDHPHQSIAYVRRGDGYAQYGGFPFIMTSAFHISKPEYSARRSAAWPLPGDGTFIPTRKSTDEYAVLPPTALDNWTGVKSSLPRAPSGPRADTQQNATESAAASDAVQRLIESLDQHFDEQQAGRSRPFSDARPEDSPPLPVEGAAQQRPPVEPPPRKDTDERT